MVLFVQFKLWGKSKIDDQLWVCLSTWKPHQSNISVPHFAIHYQVGIKTYYPVTTSKIKAMLQHTVTVV